MTTPLTTNSQIAFTSFPDVAPSESPVETLAPSESPVSSATTDAVIPPVVATTASSSSVDGVPTESSIVAPETNVESTIVASSSLLEQGEEASSTRIPDVSQVGTQGDQPATTPSVEDSASSTSFRTVISDQQEPSDSPQDGASTEVEVPPPTTVATSTDVQTPPPAAPSTSIPVSDWLPQTIITQSAEPTTEGKSATETTSTGVPTLASTLPRVIAPSGGIPETPEDSTLIQIGFDYSLNYPFIVSHPLSVAQIFQYLPMGLSYGLGIDAGNVSMRSIEPYQSQSAGYVISVAMAYVPTKFVSTLDAIIHTPTSQLYRNPNRSVNTLMNLIDPSIPLIPGTNTDANNNNNNNNQNQPSNGTPTQSGADGDSSPSETSVAGINDNKAGLEDSGSLDQPVQESAPVSSKTVGIAVGAVAGAVAYGGLMFLVAKKYRQKNRLELEGRDSPYLATGGPSAGQSMRNTVVTATSPLGSRHSPPTSLRGGGPIPREQISEPVMSENSLGWT